jgi:Lrp/AsnC family leucine-responsive transcriptional regulator
MCNDLIMKPLLDEIDCAILALLQEEGDVPNVELARRTGLSPAASSRRVRTLRDAGVIVGVHARVDADAVGVRLEAFVFVTLREQTDNGDQAFAEALSAIPAVVRADRIAGRDDVLLHVVTSDARSLQQVLQQLQRVGAARATTLLRLAEIKPPSPWPVEQSRRA